MTVAALAASVDAVAATITLQDGVAPGTTATQYNNTVDGFFDRLNPDTVQTAAGATITVNADQTMWLQFGNLTNIFPLDLTVTAVTIELTVSASSGASTYSVYVVDASKAVSIGNMTYNRYAGGVAPVGLWELPGANGPTDRGAAIATLDPAAVVGGKISFTLPTATLTSWATNANSNRGLLIQNESAAMGDFMTFVSESGATASEHPKLDVTWTSDSYFWFQNTSNNFHNSNNWSEVDLYRVPKGAAPNGATHRVYFSNTNSGAGTNANCNLQPNGDFTLYLLQTRNGYTGSWSNTSRSFTIGDGGFFIDSDMTYNHGTGNVTVSGSMRVSNAANLTLSDPATITVGGTCTVSSNNTEVIINGNGGITCGVFTQSNTSTVRIQGGGSLITTTGGATIGGGTFQVQTGNINSFSFVTISNSVSFSMQNGTINAPSNPGLSIQNSASFTKGNGTITADDLRISTSVAVSFTTETITIADDVAISGTTGPPTVDFSNTTMTVGDTFSLANACVVNMNNCPVTIGNDLTVANTATFNQGGASISITDDLILSGSGTFNMNTGSLVVGDDLNMSGTCVYNMTNASLTITDNIVMSGGTYNAHPGTDLYVGENFQMTGGTFVAPPAGQVMWVGGSFTHTTAGTFQNNGGLVKMQPLGAPYNSPNANVSLSSLQSLWDLEIYRTNSNDDVTLTGSVNVDNDITISDGEFRMAGFTMYLGGDWIRNTVDTAFFPQTGTVVFDEAQSITLTELDPFYNVEIAKTGGNSVTLGNDHDIDNNFTITSGTYDVSASNWYVVVAGAIVQTGGTFVQRQGWVVLDGGNQSPSLTNMTFYALAASGTGTKSFTGNLTIETSVTVRSGVTLSFSSGTCTALTTTCFTNQSGTMSFQDGVLPTAGYAGTADTWLDVSNTTTNYGNSTAVNVDGSPDQSGLFRWNLRPLPPGSTISAASIQFTIFDPTNDVYEVYRLRRRWVETEATWLLANATTSWSTAGANNTTTDRENTVLGTIPNGVTGTQTLNLAAAIYPFVQSWADLPESNTGFVVLDFGVTDGVDIRSSEFATTTDRPRFNVTYNTIQGTIRVGPGGTIVVPNGTAISQGTSATWEFTGTDSLVPASRASLISNNPGVATWSMSIPASSTFRGLGARFVDGNITVADNVTELTIADAAFESLPTGTTNYIDISAVTTGMINFRRLAFDRGSNVTLANARNIRASATTVPVTVGGYSGNLGGELYDDDPLNRIRWANNQEMYEVVHSVNGTTYAYSLPAALATLPTAGQTLTIRGQYVSGSTVVSAFNVHHGRLVTANFAGTLNLDGFKFVTSNTASGVMLDLGAKTAGIVNCYNCAFVDYGNGGVARAILVPPPGAASVSLRFCTANTTSAASGVDGTNTNNIYTMSLTAGQRASRFVDHDNGDYHLTRDGIQSGGYAATRDATFIRDLDGRTRTSGASQTFQGCYHAAVSAVYAVAVKDLATGTTGSTNTEFIYTSIPVNNAAGNVVYLAGATATTVRLSAMARSGYAVAAGNTVTWAGSLAGHVTVRQCIDDSTKYWLYVPFDSNGDGYFDTIRKVLHNSTAQTLTDNGNLTIVNRAGAAIDFTSNGGWNGQLQFSNEFTGGPANEFQIGIVTPAGGGQVHTWFLNANSTNGNFYRTAAFDNVGVAAESYVGGAGFNLNPRLDSIPMLGGSPSGGTLWLSRTADANTSIFIRFTRQDAASTVNNVTVDNSVAGSGAGSSFATTPFQLFRSGSRRVSIRSDIPRFVSLSHQTLATNNLDVGGVAGFAGATSTSPVGFFDSLQLFFGLYNATTGRGAVVATEYSPTQDGDATQEILDTTYTAQSSKLIYSDDTGTNGSFSAGIAPVMGMPTRLAYAPLPATNTAVFCATDAGLLYAWEAAGIPSTSNTQRKGQLLNGFPVQIPGGRITAMTFVTLTDATLKTALNLTADANVLACTTDSGQVILVRVPEIP